MLHNWKSNYRFYYFFSYLNPGFLPIYLPQISSFFCATDKDSLTKPSIKKYENWLFGTSYIDTCKDNLTHNFHFVQPTILENYQFIRNYYGLSKCVSILLIRTIRKPIRIIELKHVLSLRKTNKAQKIESTIHAGIHSDLIDIKVSVVIPTKNRRKYLLNILSELNSQSKLPYEVIVIDQSDKFESINNDALNFNLIHLSLSNKGQASAKNEGITIASSEYILQLDDDISISSNLIEEHLKCILQNNADASTGSYVKESQYVKKETAYSIAAHLPAGNSLIKKNIFHDVGLYNTKYDNLPIEDTDLFIRCIKHGKRIILNHAACIIHYEANTGGMRNHFLTRIPAIESLKWLKSDVHFFYTQLIPKELFIRLLISTNYRYFVKGLRSPFFIFSSILHVAILPFFIYKLFLINKS